MMTLEEFERQIAQSLRMVVPELEATLPKIGAVVEIAAERMPGEYQPGWAKLAESTLADKARKGFPVPSPLRRTSAMAESYRHEVAPAALEVVVGSPSKIALYQEMGTSRIPPRPVLALAMQRSIKYATGLLGNAALKILTGGRLLK